MDRTTSTSLLPKVDESLERLSNENETVARLRAASLTSTQSQVKAKMFAHVCRTLLAGGADKNAPTGALFVPGRVEVFGKHTDYCGGHSLLIAVERGFCMVASANKNAGRIRVLNAGAVSDQPSLSDGVEFQFDADLQTSPGHWSHYLRSTTRRLARDFPIASKHAQTIGLDVAFTSDLPPAAGLSSSSALIVGFTLLLASHLRANEDPAWKEQLSSAEEFCGYFGAIESGRAFAGFRADGGVGTTGGSQDHTAILLCKPSQVSRFSFCPVKHEGDAPWPTTHTLVVANSGVLAEKTGAAMELYNAASRRVADALKFWNTSSSRADATLIEATRNAPEAVRDALSRSDAPKEVLERVEQFLLENNEFIPQAFEAFKRGDIETVGKMSDRSQAASETLLRNQTPETIRLQRVARELGATAASCFGAGFGGSCWALIKADQAESFAQRWVQEYSRSVSPQTAKGASAFLSAAGPAVTAV